MKYFFPLTVLAAILSASVSWAGGNTKAPPCSGPEFRQLDFWVGTWNLTWTKSDGTKGKGKNVISRSMGGCVIEEHFTSLEGKRPFAGMSVSTYDAKARTWHQTWVDNSGGYLPFTGGRSDEGFQLRLLDSADGRTMRMIWTNVERDSLDWHWQQSKDGGRTWQDRWLIHYKRAD